MAEGRWTDESIYLDNNATTRVAPGVVEAMSPHWREVFGNPSSLHLAGQSARAALEMARERVATLIGAAPRDIVFTSGGTEADNLAILGTLATSANRRHVVASAVEHVAVYDLCRRFRKQGYEVALVGVDHQGRLDPEVFEAALRPDTAIACAMHANNETGVLFPAAEISAICNKRGVPLLVDAVQSAGKIPVNVDDLGATFVSLSAHKMHGPKGAGALYVGRGARLAARLAGGHQERDLRPGTENVPAIVGFGEAAALAMYKIRQGSERERRLRDRLEEGLLHAGLNACVLGDRENRIWNTTNIAFPGRHAEQILIALSQQGICASSGSACSSGSIEPSHVLQAMGLDAMTTRSAVRFSLSWDTTDQEIDRALELIPAVIARLPAIDGLPA